MGLSERDALIVDHEKAQTYGTKYLGRMTGELFARGQILTLAMDGFNKFLSLPPGDTKASAIWDLGFNLLATAVPMLRLAKFIDTQHTAASTAYQIAKAVGDKALAAKAKTVATVTGALKTGGKVAPKIDSAKEKIGKITEPAGKVLADDAGEEAASDLAKRLDASRAVIKSVIADGNKAREAWEKALDAEVLTFENRLSGADKTTKKSQLDYIQELLPPVPVLTSSELDQIEAKYLWLMIGAYCRSNVSIVTNTETAYIHTVGRTETRVSSSTNIKGLNNTQQAQLLEFFGPAKRRGKIFTEPPVINAYHFLYYVKTPEVKSSTTTNYFSETLK